MRHGAKTQFARSLRKNLTEAEVRLWFHLRRKQMLGARFRRPHPMGPYIVDFICIESRLVIEVDGSQPLDSNSDAARDAWLRNERYALLRFWNNDVLCRTDEVLSMIDDALASTRPHPPSAPSPAMQVKGKRDPGVL